MGPSNVFSWSHVFVKFVILNDFAKSAPSQIVGALSPTTHGWSILKQLQWWDLGQARGKALFGRGGPSCPL